MSLEHSGRPVLTLAELQAFDPQAPANRCWCPLCGQEKPRDNTHRSLIFDRSSGKWKCFRCGAGGTLREFWREKNPTFNSTPGQGRGGGGPSPSRGLNSPFASPAARPTGIPPVPNAVGEHPHPPHQTGLQPGPSTQPPPLAWREKWEAALPLENTPGAEYLLRRGIPPEIAGWAEVRYSTDWNAAPPASTTTAASGGEQAVTNPSAINPAATNSAPHNPTPPNPAAAKARRAMTAVVFPIRDQQGTIVAAQARAIHGDAKLTAGPKKDGAFFAPVQMKSGRVFSPLDRGTPVVTITEAPIDALSLACAGFPAIALCGTSGPSWLHIACGLRRVALALDADEAGDRAADELMQLLSPFGTHCFRLKPEGDKDWNEMLLRIGAVELGNFLTPHLL